MFHFNKIQEKNIAFSFVNFKKGQREIPDVQNLIVNVFFFLTKITQVFSYIKHPYFQQKLSGKQTAIFKDNMFKYNSHVIKLCGK